MKDWLSSVIHNKRNFTCIYSKPNHTIYSVPKSKSNFKHVAFSLLATLSFLGIAAGIKTLTHNGLVSLFNGSDSGWIVFLESLVGGVALVFLFLSLAPRLGLFPGLNGFKLELDKNSSLDKKLGQLIENNPRALNIDWMKDWHEASLYQQKEMYAEMKDALSKSSTNV